VSFTTVTTCVQVANDRGREAVVDLMGLTADRHTELAGQLPQATVLAAHVPKDLQGGPATPADLVGDWARGRRLAAAGGLSIDDLPTLATLERDLDLEWLRVIIGSAVTKAADVETTAAQLATAADRNKETAP